MANNRGKSVDWQPEERRAAGRILGLLEDPKRLESSNELVATL